MQRFYAVVTLPPDASGVVYSREGWLLVDNAAPAVLQATVEGAPAAQQLAVVSGEYVGDTIVVGTANLAVDTVQTGVVKLLEKPSDSNASVLVAAARGAASSFVADRVGRYTVEYLSVMADGQPGPATYASVNVKPHSIGIYVDLQEGPSPLPDKPPALAGATRVNVSLSLTRGIASVQGLLDGMSLGLLTQPNIQRFNSGCPHGGPCSNYYTPGWTFDFDTRSVASGSHTLRILVTDTRGQVFEVPVMVPGSGSARGNFTDANP